MTTTQDIKGAREYIKDTVQFKTKVAKTNEWFEQNFKLADNADEGRDVCEQYCAEIKAIYEYYHYEKCLG